LNAVLRISLYFTDQHSCATTPLLRIVLMSVILSFI